MFTNFNWRLRKIPDMSETFGLERRGKDCQIYF